MNTFSGSGLEKFLSDTNDLVVFKPLRASTCLPI